MRATNIAWSSRESGLVVAGLMGVAAEELEADVMSVAKEVEATAASMVVDERPSEGTWTKSNSDTTNAAS
jgi:hypothetical protein